jgi:archaellum component FlaF (FlaF/FlaG flagellin family)
MGFAASIAVAIFFLAFMIIVAITYPLVSHSISDVRDSVKEKHDIQMKQLNTRLGIVSAVSGSGTIDITISNDGSTVLHSNKSNLLLDGIHRTYSVSPNGLWLPGRNAVFTLNANTSINHTIKIITENGISIYKEV